MKNGLKLKSASLKYFYLGFFSITWYLTTYFLLFIKFHRQKHENIEAMWFTLNFGIFLVLDSRLQVPGSLKVETLVLWILRSMLDFNILLICRLI